MSASVAGFGPAARPRRISFNDRYCILLCVVLIGYATLGKGFAYIGVPPLFIGEITLALGLLALFRSRSCLATLVSPASAMLLLLLCWVVLRTIPFIGSHGVNAIRDSVIVVYGLFAFIVAALLLQRPDRLPRVIAAYARFAWIYGLTGMALANASSTFGSLIPSWPGNGIPITYLRLGECASHLAGAAAFALLGMLRIGRIWPLVMLVSLGVIAVSRGAMLAFVLPSLAAAAAARHKRRIVALLLLAVTLFGISYAAGLNVPLPGGRSFGPQQIVNGVESILGQSEAANLDGTKTWRLNWWNAIIDYTVNGPYFWTGKGFGMNLAEEDGFVVGLELGGPAVRSPHNAHMTVLARSGVPGLVLWLATLAVWFGTLGHAAIVARRRGDCEWSDVFVWIACYGAAIVIDSSFDVALEGPMLGIWFWCLFGLGVGATMIYRAERNGRPRHLLGRRGAAFGS